MFHVLMGVVLDTTSEDPDRLFVQIVTQFVRIVTKYTTSNVMQMTSRFILLEVLIFPFLGSWIVLFWIPAETLSLLGSNLKQGEEAAICSIHLPHGGVPNNGDDPGDDHPY
jgi:hypothetical protein